MIIKYKVRNGKKVWHSQVVRYVCNGIYYKNKKDLLERCNVVFNLIVSAEKMEEYREIKPHWIKRLTTNCEVPYDVAAETHYGEVLYRPYTHVLFVKGYPKGNKPSVEKKIVDITIGKPKKGLCPKEFLNKEYFIIKFK